ncbi:hypothetical protein [Methylobrevis pamukkalensis]|uniref:Uncharacterized protein n=1 Tax=Methylobrevis pamukkalensis TaxID=1439726 RepID=A0A1E3H6Z9_9HYPH|nr:hypothetical protein [Methylobrevis pamukkalensis]ODN72103.1 hypothetical protein A6302_00507 [Methylobrevis pamukkalensis]
MLDQLRPLALVASLCLAGPALAQAPEMGDEFFNIAGDPDVTLQPDYGTVRDWTVVSGFAGNRFAFCAAQMSGPDGTWRFGYDSGGQWQIAILHEFSGETAYGSLSFDGRTSGIAGWGDGLWVILWPMLGEYEAIAKSDLMEVQLGDIRRSMPLRGTAAAALKVQECVENRGVVKSAAAPRPLSAAPASAAPRMPDPKRRGETFVGDCQTLYESYRCMATTLTPTGRFGEAMEVADPLGTAPTFIVQTDKADLSQVWVSFDRRSFAYVGLWGTDGTCRTPLPDQTPEVVAALGHDGWSLCIK